jgi:hypothetical protein
MGDDDTAAPAVFVVGLAVAVIPIRTDVNTVRTDAKLHGVCRSYRSRSQRYQRSERQDIYRFVGTPPFQKVTLENGRGGG